MLQVEDVIDGEMTVLTGIAVGEGGQRAVDGIAQRAAGRDAHLDVQRAGEELVLERHHGHVYLLG